MSVTTDIPAAWVRPARVMARRLAAGVDEKVAFTFVAVASLLGFVAQLPALVRRSRESDPAFEAAIQAEAGDVRAVQVPADLADAKFEALMAGALMGWLFLVPLFLYALALVSHWIARLVGGRGTALRARVALFWSFLVITPGLLLLGLTTGFVGPGPAQALVGTATLCGFLWVWLNSLYVAETSDA